MSAVHNFKSGAVSTKQVRLSLVYFRGLRNAAKRFEEGIEVHGDNALNALAKNQEPLKDEDFLIERCSHAITHLYSLIDFLTHRSTDIEAAKGDAGAVAWCGLVLGEALCNITDSPIPSSLVSSKIVASNMDNIKCSGCQNIFLPGEKVATYKDEKYHFDCVVEDYF